MQYAIGICTTRVVATHKKQEDGPCGRYQPGLSRRAPQRSARQWKAPATGADPLPHLAAAASLANKVGTTAGFNRSLAKTAAPRMTALGL
jgi:hypothetical protein